MAKVLTLDQASLGSVCWFCRETFSKPFASKLSSRPQLFFSRCDVTRRKDGYLPSDWTAGSAQKIDKQYGKLAVGSHDAWNSDIKRVFTTSSRSLALPARAGPTAKGSLLAGVSKEHVEGVSRVLEVAAEASSRCEVAHTDFLDPPTKEVRQDPRISQFLLLVLFRIQEGISKAWPT
jgi:hypothetical protein